MLGCQLVEGLALTQRLDGQLDLEFGRMLFFRY